MNDNKRYKLLSSLKGNSELKIGDGSKITILDYLILTEYYGCEHEYGIRHKIDNGELLCNCLDCGNVLEEIHCGEIYEIADNTNYHDIRKEYLSYLLENDSKESVSELSRNGRIKSRVKTVKIERR